ncbi:MAG: hypothetical protein Q7V88_08120, partial [Actinomycetota bacterium]|nr:hypothetical protein [Actinomycetota bacterium]
MRATRALLRVLTLALLAVLLVGVPVLVVRLIGMPLPGAHQIRAAWQHRRVDGDLVLRIGAAVFSVLWLWFALTALAELWNVLSWRLGGGRARLAPVPPGPSGWVRALVRFVAVSSVSATAALGSLVPVARTASAVAPRSPVASAVVSSNSSAAAHAGRPTHQANGRETPFSVARELGRPELRDRIIELNSGRQAPDGSAWQGGVFPLGMKVVLPEEADARPAAQVAPHAVAQAVPTLLGAAHEVEAGDCYWQIADDHLAGVLDRDPTPPEVLAYTNALIEFNDDLLGHRDPTLIVPGELVILTDAGLPHDGSVAAPTVVPAAPALPGPPVVPVVPAAVPEVPAVPEVAAVPELAVVPAAVPEVATAELPAESPPPGDVGVPAVPPASEQAFPAVPVAPVAPDRPAAPVAPVAPDRPAAPA